MLRKVSRHGAGYSVADLNKVRYVFVSAVSPDGSDLPDQTLGALETVGQVIHEEATLGAIVRQAVFVREPAEIEPCCDVIHEFYGPDLPATTYVVQPPCEGRRVAIEAWGVSRRSGDLEIERVSENLVVLHHDEIAWAHCAGIRADAPPGAVHERSLGAFAAMRDLLADHGFAFDQVVRTWLYLGDIVGPEGDGQRYQELNRARADFYHGTRFLARFVPRTFDGAIYPASTGIGARGSEVTMGCIALSTARDDIRVLPLENPVQTPAFHYEAHHSPHSPRFSRAVAIVGREACAILVSGTASIVGSETFAPTDVGAQTQRTLDNIAALISPENFARYGIRGVGAALGDLALARVYVKRPEDYPTARAVCDERLGELPVVFAIADVCRPELLVEIEGVAVVPIHR